MREWSILVLLAFVSIDARQTISLNGKWIGSISNSTSSNNGSSTSFEATVPGGIYTDLENAKLIPPNLVGKNDVNNRWVGNSTVTYITHFKANEIIGKNITNVLVFHGLDTFATAYINNKIIGRTSNMFTRYSFDVTDSLKKDVNELKVVFDSAVKTATEIFNEQTTRYLVPPKCVPDTYHGECHVNHIRKMQASFSWDWGPAFPSIGIWKDVELVSVENVLVSSVTTDIVKKNKTWQITATAFLEIFSDGPFTIVAMLRIDENKTFTNSSTVKLSTNKKNTDVSVILNIPDDSVALWWPNEYGDPVLYNLTVLTNSATPNKTTDVTEQQFRVGFRTVELVQEPLDSGLSFYFKVNNVSIFAKGSNWIPASIFPELSSKEDTVKHLLTSAKTAHMNMLRVWGGGVYESDLFYDLADEYGIMIWQDFMFACSMYPSSEWFLDFVREEVIQNVRRLKRHPSIVIYAGNNENEAALYDNWYQTGNEQIYKDDYIKLYVDVIKRQVELLDPLRPFVVSSPSDGLLTEQHNFIGPNPFSKKYGDVHYYNYISNDWDVSQYPRARFVSEYGFQSIPSIHTMASAAEGDDDLQVDSEFMKHRQHSLGGYAFMRRLIAMHFNIPETNDTMKDLKNYIYLSQINQAVAVKIQTEFYRQSKDSLDDAGQGMTMGALYWQLNDVWQAPSWSSIEFGGRWKMLHYYAAKFFAPVIITSYTSPIGTLTISVVSDKQQALENCILTISTYNWQSNIPIYVENTTNITIAPNAAMEVKNIGMISNYLYRLECGSPLSIVSKKCVIELTLTDKDGNLIAPHNYVYPSPLKDVALPSANITVEIEINSSPNEQNNTSEFRIVLTSDNIVLFVWLDIGNIQGQFSENGFHIFRGEKVVTLRTTNSITREEILEYLSVRSLSDMNEPNEDDDNSGSVLRQDIFQVLLLLLISFYI